MTDTTHDHKTDDKTTLAKVNDSAPARDETQGAAGEREDTVTVLARINGNPPAEDNEPR